MIGGGAHETYIVILVLFVHRFGIVVIYIFLVLIVNTLPQTFQGVSAQYIDILLDQLNLTHSRRPIP